MATKTWTAEEISDLIQTNDRVLYNALKKLYSYQTATEQEHKDTHVVNGVGFNSYDAPILSDIAEFLIRTGFLTYNQKRLVRKKLKKYTNQLVKIANGTI